MQNEYKQFSEGTTEKGEYDPRSIVTSRNFRPNISSLLSFSTYNDHSILITTEGRGFAIGTNNGSRIIGTLPEGPFDKEEEIILKDDKGRT